MQGTSTNATPEADSAAQQTPAARVLALEEEYRRLAAELAAVAVERDQVRTDLEAVTREHDAFAALARLVFEIDEERTAVLLDGLDRLQYQCEQIDAIARRRDPDRIPKPQPRASRPWDGDARALDLISATIDVIAARDRMTRAAAITRMRNGADTEDMLRELCRRLEERDRAMQRRRGRPRKRGSP
jgi:hypothetical protein